MSESKTCPECGAVLPEGAEQCGLCGTSVSSPSVEHTPSVSEGEGLAGFPDEESPEAEVDAERGIFCTQCGWKNPPAANFCSRCGHELQSGTMPPASVGTKPAAGPSGGEGSESAGGTAAVRAEDEQEQEDSTAATDAGLRRRVAMVAGIAVLLVAGLYGWSVWSEGQEPAGAAASEGGRAPMMSGGTNGGAPSGGVPEVIRRQQEGDVPASIATQVDSLQNVISTRSGRRSQLARRELASVFVSADLTSRAAAQQWLLAREADTPASWERAGSLLYDWMASLERGQRRAQVARLTADAYQRVLQNDPDNHDVRTNLALAYLSTNNPMRGISEIKRVLREAPDHVGARFNYGLTQMWIGRLATAVEQFEHVRRVAGEDSPFYQQAGQYIQRINEQTNGNPQDAPMPGEGTGS